MRILHGLIVGGYDANDRTFPSVVARLGYLTNSVHGLSVYVYGFSFSARIHPFGILSCVTDLFARMEREQRVFTCVFTESSIIRANCYSKSFV